MRTLSVLFILGLFTNIAVGQVTKVWETDTIFQFPESVAYDRVRDVLYVSNYTKNPAEGLTYGDACISKISKSGEMIQYDWIGNLTSPSGITVANDKLYIVERFGIVEYDLQNDRISNKYMISNTVFLNDITIGEDTTIFVSDSESNVIYKIKNSKVEKWLESDEIKETNGVLLDGDKLILGVNSDNYLKSVDINTKEIKKIAFLDEGTIDGIKKKGDNYLVSHFLGDLNLVKPNGEVIELLNTREEKVFCADFEYIEKENMVIVPALRSKKLFAYQLDLK